MLSKTVLNRWQKKSLKESNHTGLICPPFWLAFGALSKKFLLVYYISFLLFCTFSCATVERTKGSKVENRIQAEIKSPTIDEDLMKSDQDLNELLSLTEEILDDYETVVERNENLEKKNETLKKVSRASIIVNLTLFMGFILVLL